MNDSSRSPVPTGRIRVLLIDDDPQLRNLLTAFLRRDYLVSVACEGMEGYAKALKHPPNIAIIDIQMPGWDGIRTLQAFRSHPDLKDVRTVVLTADATRQTVVAAIDAGADDYIVKTALSRETLLSKLDRVRRRPASVSPTSVEPYEVSTETSDDEFAPPSEGETDNSHKVAAASPLTSVSDEQQRLQAVLDAWE